MTFQQLWITSGLYVPVAILWNEYLMLTCLVFVNVLGKQHTLIIGFNYNDVIFPGICPSFQDSSQRFAKLQTIQPQRVETMIDFWTYFDISKVRSRDLLQESSNKEFSWWRCLWSVTVMKWTVTNKKRPYQTSEELAGRPGPGVVNSGSRRVVLIGRHILSQKSLSRTGAGLTGGRRAERGPPYSS